MDRPRLVFKPNRMICFSGFNESYTMADEASSRTSKINTGATWRSNPEHWELMDSPFAFHSPNRASSETNVVIHFHDPTMVGLVKRFNRRDAALHDRTNEITVWVSESWRVWREAWHSEEAYPDWLFEQSMEQTIHDAKLGLQQSGIPRLDRVVFGGKADPEGQNPTKQE